MSQYDQMEDFTKRLMELSKASQVPVYLAQSRTVNDVKRFSRLFGFSDFNIGEYGLNAEGVLVNGSDMLQFRVIKNRNMNSYYKGRIIDPINTYTHYGMNKSNYMATLENTCPICGDDK